MRTATKEAFDLWHCGAQVLSQIEHNGMCVDEDYLNRKITETDKKIKSLQQELKEDNIWKTWKRRFGNESNLTSRRQLGIVLFDELGIKYTGEADTDEEPKKNKQKYKVDQDVLGDIDSPFVKLYLEMMSLSQSNGTFLADIKRELCNGKIHCNYNLNLAVTFRSSCSEPNMQNMPIRDKILGELIRRCFIPRKGRHLVEIDFGRLEVFVGYCITGDTKIETIDGSQSIRKVIRRVNKGENVYVYGYSKKRGRIAVSKVTAGGITATQSKIWKVLLDNGKYVRATASHKFMMRDGTYKELRHLLPGDSLMPFYKTKKVKNYGVYENIYLNNGSNSLAHNLIALDVRGVDISKENKVVHHWDHNGCNNSLDNTEVMSRKRHMRIHSIEGWIKKPGGSRFSKKQREASSRRSKRMMLIRKETWTEKDWYEFRMRIKEAIKRNGGYKGYRNPRYGTVCSQETKDKISKAKKGVKQWWYSWCKGLTKETNTSLKSMSDKQKGKIVSDQTRAKLSLACKGIPKTEEWKQKIRGQLRSDATKQLISISKKKYWKDIKESGNKETCSLCGNKFTRVTNTHLKHKHGVTLDQYKITNNHKVVSVKFDGYEDVYNINVEGFHNYATNAGVIIKNCYHKDPVMRKYLLDPTTDMHRDMAMKCFFLEKDEVNKDIRYAAKNQFVFAECYGSYYLQCAKAMWHYMLKHNLTLSDGSSLKKHLRSHGIRELGACNPKEKPRKGTFEHHIQTVEDYFWNTFKIYDKWRDDWWKLYQTRGWIQNKTGFVVEGIYSRNQIINSPIQSSAFHILLWSIIELQKWLTKYKLKSLIVAEVHDSLLADVVDEEFDEFVAMAVHIMTVATRKHWDWITLPLEVEVEASNTNWYEKQKVKI